MDSISVTKLATLSGHKDPIYALSSSQDSNIFYSSGADGFVTSWNSLDPKDGTLIAKVPNSVYSMAAPGADRLLIGHNYDGVHLLDTIHKKEIGTLKLTEKQIFDILILNDAAYVGSGDGVLSKVNTENLTIMNQKSYSNKSLRTIAISPDKSALALGFSDNHIRIVHPDTLEVITAFEGHANSIFSLCYVPDTTYLLSGSRDAYIRVWDTSKAYGKHHEVIAHMWAINDIALSPDGKHFVTCSMDKTMKIWDTLSFKLLKVIDRERYDGHTSSVNKLLWLANNKVISASDDRTIIVWEIEFE